MWLGWAYRLPHPSRGVPFHDPVTTLQAISAGRFYFFHIRPECASVADSSIEAFSGESTRSTDGDAQHAARLSSVAAKIPINEFRSNWMALRFIAPTDTI